MTLCTDQGQCDGNSISFEIFFEAVLEMIWLNFPKTNQITGTSGFSIYMETTCLQQPINVHICEQIKKNWFGRNNNFLVYFLFVHPTSKWKISIFIMISRHYSVSTAGYHQANSSKLLGKEQNMYIIPQYID